MSVSTREVGKEAGVSQQTASYVLTGRWREKRISETTRDAVLEAARRLNYRPNRIARSLLSGQTYTLGLVIPCITDSFFPVIARAIDDWVDARGYQIMLCNSDLDAGKERREVDLLLERRVDGLILAPARGDGSLEAYRELEAEEIPLVIINDRFEELKTSYVMTDDRAGAYEAVTHLIGLGHERIAYLSGPRIYAPCRDKVEGYRDALRDAGIEADASLVREGSFSQEDGYRLTMDLLRSPSRPTAVFAVCDEAAVGVWQAAVESGLRVPEDVAIVGYGDDLPGAPPVFEVPLTTVRQPTREIGERAAGILIDTIEGRCEGVQEILLPAELVIRSSSSPK